MSTAPSAPVDDGLAPSTSPGGDLHPAIGWALVGLLTLGLLMTWAPSLSSGLGDNHEGRILARHALNIANAERDGLAASGWLSDWSPYVGDGGEQTSYAHHPPLLNLGYYAAAQVLPVPRDTAIRLVAYLLGAAMLPIGAAVLRRLGMGWAATLVATALIAVTPLFWVYGRLHANVTLALALVLMVVRLQERRRIGGGELALAAVVAVVAVVAGYLGMAIAAVSGLWLLARRGVDRVTVVMGIAMAAAAAVSLGYVVGVTGAGRVGEQLQLRTSTGEVGVAAFVERIGTWLTSLLPVWWRWLVLPAAMLAGLADRRTRALTALLALVAVGYVVGLPNGAFVHDYWVFPLLLPVWLGAAALVDALTAGAARRWPRPTGHPGPEREPVPVVATALGAGLLVVVLALGAWSGLRADIPSRYLTGPERAGTLVRSVGPAPGQEVAWRGPGLATPRWLSYYWQLPPGELDPDQLAELDPTLRVLVRTDRLDTLAPTLPEVLARDGDYAVVTVGQLRAART